MLLGNRADGREPGHPAAREGRSPGKGSAVFATSRKALQMESGSDARRTTGTTAVMRGRLRSLAMIVIFDVAGPLAAYYWLRSAGLSTVTALILSGLFPALGVTINAVRHRRLDVVGAVVLAGIIVGAALGLVSHNAKLVLVEGSVPTAIFGVACLGSLWAQRPLMFSLVLEFVGPDTAKGRDMAMFWHHAGFRHSFRVITAAWGVALLIEAALRGVIIYNTSAGTALAISKVTPYLFVGIMLAWTLAYTRHQKNKFERMAAADAEVAEAAGEVAEAAGAVTQAAGAVTQAGGAVAGARAEVTEASPEAAGPNPVTPAPTPAQSAG
jgi:hypothetical protein